MPTIFERLTIYQQRTGHPKLSHHQKSCLGRSVARTYYNNPSSPKLTFTKSTEDTGVFDVILYPDFFTEILDELIEAYCKSLVKKRKRRPVWTSKPSTHLLKKNNG